MRRSTVAEKRALPTDAEVRTYMRKVRGFRDSLNPGEQRMLDAIVVASFWPEEGAADTRGYRLLPPHTIYDEDTGLPPFDVTPWARAWGNG